MNLAERITFDPAICHGKPVIRGLRYPVETILELLGAGMTYEEVLADYEDLEREDLLAALSFAAEFIRQRTVKSKFNLADLVAQMPPDYKPREAPFGPPTGKEEW